MEKKSLSIGDISKKLIWEYIVASFILGIISYFTANTIINTIENSVVKLITFAIVNFIIVFMYVWIGSRNIIQKYIIRREDVSTIIRNISIFFVIMIILNLFNNYSSYKKNVEKESKLYSNFVKIDEDEYMSEYLNEYMQSGNLADAQNKMQEKQEKIFKQEMGKKYRTFFVGLVVYNIVVYGIMIILQKKWLLNAAE